MIKPFFVCKIPVVGSMKPMPEIFAGQKLRYKLPHDTVNADSAFRTNDVPVRRLNETHKKNFPNASLWCRKKDEDNTYRSIIVADFDSLPKAFETWDEFYLDMCSKYGTASVVNRSVSGKCKILFPVKSNGYMTQDKAIGFLRTVLNTEDFDIIDMSLPALNLTYINEHMLEGLHLACAMEFISLNDNKSENKTETRYHEYDGVIPEFVQFFIGADAKKERFTRILLATHNLIETRGFGLSQTVLAAQCDTSTASISKWLKTFQEMKLLKCVDANWEYKKKAKIYVATWMLATAIKEAKEKQRKTKRPAFVAKQQYSLVAGEAYMFLLNEVKQCASIEEIKDVIHGLNSQGFSLAKRIWRTHSRYGRLSKAA